LNPSEGGIVDGKQITLEPAFKTTFLHAVSDGTISHEAQFLDTASGRTAQRLYEQQVGGFSSAIHSRRHNNLDIPIGFHGFDYVLDPNYNANRGHDVVLDSAGMACEQSQQSWLLDSVNTAAHESDLAIQVLDSLHVSLQQAHAMNLQALAAIEQENAELRSMVLNGNNGGALQALQAQLDSASVFSRPMRIDTRFTDTLRSQMAGFSSMNKAVLEDPAQRAQQAKAQSDRTNLIHSMGLSGLIGRGK
jgi:hypothetical protein